MYLIAPLANKPATFLFKNVIPIWHPFGCKKCVESSVLDTGVLCHPASAETSCRTATRAFRAWKIAKTAMVSGVGHHRKRSSRHTASHNYSNMLSDMWSLVTSESGLSLVFQGDFILWHPILNRFHLTLAVCHASRREMPAKPCPSNRSLGPLDSWNRWSHQLTGGMTTTTRCSNHVHLYPPGNDHISHHGNMDGQKKSSTQQCC